jgi:hypothetical protein
MIQAPAAAETQAVTASQHKIAAFMCTVGCGAKLVAFESSWFTWV